MIDRRADERQAERDVNAVAEARGFEHRQTLVVVHRDNGVVTARDIRHKYRVGGNRSGDVVTLRTSVDDRRSNDIDLFASKMSSFARVRIEPADGDSRLGQAECRLELARDDLERRPNTVARQRGSDVLQRQMRSRECDTQGRCRITADQHHDNAPRVRAFGEELGVAGKRDAAVLDRALLHRRRHHCGKLAGGTAVASAFQHRQNTLGVRRIGMTGRRLHRQRSVQNFYRGFPRERRRIVVDVEGREAYPLRPLVQQHTIADKDKARRRPLFGVPLREHGEQFRSDAGRFAARHRNRRHVRHCVHMMDPHACGFAAALCPLPPKGE